MGHGKLLSACTATFPSLQPRVQHIYIINRSSTQGGLSKSPILGLTCLGYAHKEQEEHHQSTLQRGSTWKSQNINITMQYVEDVDGVPVDGDRAGAMRQHAWVIWDHFATKGMPVKTWTKTDSLNQQCYYTDKCWQFPELRLCDLN